MTQTVDLETLSHQLNQLSKHLTAFEDILNQEATTLKSADLSPLTEILKNKEKLSIEVSNQFDAISTQLFDKPLSLNEIMLLESFKNFPEKIQQQFKQTVDLAVVCSDKNLANGMMVQSLNNMNTTLLQLLKGQDPQNKTYNASGESSADTKTSNTLGKA